MSLINSRAADVTTWMDPQVSLFLFFSILYFDFPEMNALQFGF